MKSKKSTESISVKISKKEFEEIYDYIYSRGYFQALIDNEKVIKKGECKCQK